MQMSRFSMVLATTVLCSSLFSSSLALADEKEEAIKLFSAGNELRVAEKYTEALEKYRAAYSLLPSFKIDFNIALTLEKMGRNAEAVRAYEKFLETGAGKSPEKKNKLAREKILGLKTKVAEVKVECNVDGAVVKMDGKDVGKIPLKESLLLEPGKHNLNVETEGHKPFVQELALEAGKETTVRVSLKPKEVAKPEPAVSDKVDDTPVQEDVTQATVSDAEDSRSAKHSSKTIWAWTTLGVGLACAVGAGVLYGVGSSQVSSAYDEYDALTAAESAETFDEKWADVESAGNLYIGGHVLAGVAAAAVGVSIYMFVTRPSMESDEVGEASGLSIGFSAGSQGANLVVSGGF